MTGFIASIMVSFASGVVAHFYGRPATAQIDCTQRTRDLTRYGIGMSLAYWLIVLFCPKAIRKQVANLTGRIYAALGLGVIVAMFITGEDDYA
jgi:hypothetical protein